MKDMPHFVPSRTLVKNSVVDLPSALDNIVSTAQVHAAMRTPYIGEYLAYNSLPPVSAYSTSNGKLRSTIVSYEDSQSDENDLREWTRFMVKTHRKPQNPEPKPKSKKVLKLDVDKFIDFLVEHKNFDRKNLEFLRRQDLDYGYDQIEDELAKIKRDEDAPHTICIGGENDNFVPGETSGFHKSHVPVLYLLASFIPFV